MKIKRLRSCIPTVLVSMERWYDPICVCPRFSSLTLECEEVEENSLMIVPAVSYRPELCRIINEKSRLKGVFDIFWWVVLWYLILQRSRHFPVEKN